ncbi:hypothetical protein BaRGS_00006271, partial [Batillaria attramentaria]
MGPASSADNGQGIKKLSLIYHQPDRLQLPPHHAVMRFQLASLSWGTKGRLLGRL